MHGGWADLRVTPRSIDRRDGRPLYEHVEDETPKGVFSDVVAFRHQDPIGMNRLEAQSSPAFSSWGGDIFNAPQMRTLRPFSRDGSESTGG